MDVSRPCGFFSAAGGLRHSGELRGTHKRCFVDPSAGAAPGSVRKNLSEKTFQGPLKNLEKRLDKTRETW